MWAMTRCVRVYERKKEEDGEGRKRGRKYAQTCMKRLRITKLWSR